MPVCPICHKKYRAGVTRCADCGTPLTQTPSPPSVPSDAETTDRTSDEPVLLCSISDGLTANLVMAALQDDKIPAMIQIQGAGQYNSIVSGASSAEKDIYVPPGLYAQASEIVARITIADGDPSHEDESEESPASGDAGSSTDAELQETAHAMKTKRRKAAAIFFGALIILVLILYCLGKILHLGS